MKLNPTSFLLGLLLPLALLGVQSLGHVESIELPRANFSPPYPPGALEKLPIHTYRDAPGVIPVVVLPGERLIVLGRAGGETGGVYVYKVPVSSDPNSYDLRYDWFETIGGSSGSIDVFNTGQQLNDFLDEGSYVFASQNSLAPPGSQMNIRNGPFLAYRVQL